MKKRKRKKIYLKDLLFDNPVIIFVEGSKSVLRPNIFPSFNFFPFFFFTVIKYTSTTMKSKEHNKSGEDKTVLRRVFFLKYSRLCKKFRVL